MRWTWEKKDGAAWVDVEDSATSTDVDGYGYGYPLPLTQVCTLQRRDEIGAVLRVGVEYIDNDDDNQAIAAVTFEQPVAASVGGTNVLPVFADVPASDDPTTTRTIAEDASAGTAVGDPVTATDDHRTALTYTDDPADEWRCLSASDEFKIDPKTGQIQG